MHKIDLNADLGESFGCYTLGSDEEMLEVVTSVNIACGWHAGDPLTMEKVVKISAERGVAIGAHPGYPDLLGFGRRNMSVAPEEIKAYVLYQIGALYAFCKAQGVKMHHVKPHGAMYNFGAKDYRQALAICEAVADIDSDLILVGLSGSELIRAADDVGLRSCCEVFADRAYEEDGSLVARSRPGSMILDKEEVAARVIRMIQQGIVTTINGSDIEIQTDSICLHGDSPQALELAYYLRKALVAEGIVVTSFN